MEDSVKILKKLLGNKKIQLISLCFIMIVLHAKDISKGELFFNNDETRHAFAGVFMRDLLTDLPTDPIQYTYEYYAQYPAVAIIHWPPVFYFVEAIFYDMFGISVLTGRLAILFFSIIGIIYWYRLVLKMHTERIAFFSSILLLTCHPIFFYSKMIMLEIPGLALSIAAIYYYYNYISDGKRKDIYLWSIFFALAILTKQNNIFLVLLFFAHSIVTKKANIFWKKDVLFPAIIFFILVVPYNIIVLVVSSSVVSKDLLKGTTDQAGSLFNIDTYLFYMRILPDQVGWIILLLFILSIFYLIQKKEVKENMICFVWIVVCYLTFTLIAQKASRYIMAWIPPIILLSVCFLDSIDFKIRKIRAGFLILVVLSISQVVHAARFERPYISGYEKSAKFVLDKTDKGVVFFDGYLDANFIFFVRKNDIDRQVIVLRGGKTLVSTNIYSNYGIVYNAVNEQEIIDIFKDFGIKYIVVEDKIISNIEIFRTLRHVLEDNNQFRMLQKVSIDSNIEKYKNMNLLIYEYKNAVIMRKPKVELKMLTLGGKVIELDLEKFSKKRK